MSTYVDPRPLFEEHLSKPLFGLPSELDRYVLAVGGLLEQQRRRRIDGARAVYALLQQEPGDLLAKLPGIDRDYGKLPNDLQTSVLLAARAAANPDDAQMIASVPGVLSEAGALAALKRSIEDLEGRSWWDRPYRAMRCSEEWLISHRREKLERYDLETSPARAEERRRLDEVDELLNKYHKAKAKLDRLQFEADPETSPLPPGERQAAEEQKPAATRSFNNFKVAVEIARGDHQHLCIWDETAKHIVEMGNAIDAAQAELEEWKRVPPGDARGLAVKKAEIASLNASIAALEADCAAILRSNQEVDSPTGNELAVIPEQDRPTQQSGGTDAALFPLQVRRERSPWLARVARAANDLFNEHNGPPRPKEVWVRVKKDWDRECPNEPLVLDGEKFDEEGGKEKYRGLLRTARNSEKRG